MEIERFYTEGIAQNGYLVADGGEAVVIDPRRDVDVYLDHAAERGLRVRYVLETHRNEDYVIGSTGIAAATGAQVLHGRGIDFGYGEPASEGDEIGVGRLRLRVLETPGHTPESLSFALADTREGDDPFAVFTGDALFIGDTGRTDLTGDARRAAGRLHESLVEKILPLGEGVALCPAHGGGSVCGGNISDRALSSLGFERAHNALLRADREAFVEAKTEEEHLVPPYFRRMEEWNATGKAPVYARVPMPDLLEPGDLVERVRDGAALVLDARMPQAFAGGHIPGSVNVWPGGLSSYVPWSVPVGKPIVLVLPGGMDPRDAMRTLLRIGYDEVLGVLRGGFESWQNEGRPIGRVGTLDAANLRARLDRGEPLQIVDVRKPTESAAGTIEGAARIFVGELEQRLGELSKDRPVVSLCSVGHRGGVGASLLARHGFEEVYNLLGGYTAWQAQEGGGPRAPSA